MNTFAYCAKSFRQATAQATGVKPLTCPPLSAKNFPLGLLAGRDFIYFDLHGAPGEAAWYGDDRLPALLGVQLAQVDLGGAVVFASNCYLGDAFSPMLTALLEAGARYVIAGEGKNYGPGRSASYGAAQLGKWVRRLLQFGMPPPKALSIAKRMQRGRGRIKADTLAFHLYERKTWDKRKYA